MNSVIESNPYKSDPISSTWLANKYIGTYNNPGAFLSLCSRFKVDAYNQEVFIVFGLNTKNRLTFSRIVSLGIVNATLVSPKEVLRPALLAKGTSAIIISHNHPSGDAAPSREDDILTNRIRQAGKDLGIPLVDHIIMGAEENYSYRTMQHWDGDHT